MRGILKISVRRCGSFTIQIFIRAKKCVYFLFLTGRRKISGSTFSVKILILVDDDRMRLEPGEKIEHGKIRFRTLGCYPLTGGIESDADTLDAIIDETLSAVSSERTSRVIDSDGGAASMEKRKREGYF